MSGMTLPDWLLACIAQDEDDLSNSRVGDDPEWWMPGMWTRTRALAECAAKRQIVADCDEYVDSRITDGLSDRALEYLGLPYADRPGYRDEWRP
jgi:hypothetical protein